MMLLLRVLIVFTSTSTWKIVKATPGKYIDGVIILIHEQFSKEIVGKIYDILIG